MEKAAPFSPCRFYAKRRRRTFSSEVLKSRYCRCDRISQFPDEVLSHIFSFLPIKDVVRTSILSKRWEYAWKSAPCLDFIYQPTLKSRFEDDESKLDCFKNFVDRVLFYHSGSIIQKCAFHCFSKYPCPSFYAWICAVLACNVQELYVSGSFSEGFDLPPSLFTSQRLIVLKIDGRFVLNLPSSVSFPRLKTLSLKKVMYVDDFSMQRFFSSCPVLQDLEIVRSGRDSVLITSVSVPSLKRLNITSRYSRPGHEYRIVINAPRLESLILYATGYEKFSCNFSDSLHTASIKGSCASNIVAQIAHVNKLTLSIWEMKNLNAASDLILPLFHKLTSLRLDISETIGQNLLSNLLISAPNLEELSLSLCSFKAKAGCSVSPRWNAPESPPRCLLGLKRIEFNFFDGRTYERSLLQYMLEHELVLETMTIYLSDYDSFSPSVPILNQKGSSTCRVQFGPKHIDFGYRIDGPFS